MNKQKDFSFKKIKKKAGDLAYKILPARMLASFFYLGYLPDWNRHITAIFGFILMLFCIYLLHGFGLGHPSILHFYADAAATALLLGIICLALGIVMGYVFALKERDIQKMTIDVNIAQYLIFGLASPAIIAIGNKFVGMGRFACQFLICPEWIFGIFSVIAIGSVPFFLFRFLDELEFWPTSKLRLEYTTPLMRILASLAVGAYTIIILYLVAFMFCGLNLSAAIQFVQLVWGKAMSYFRFGLSKF